MASVNIELSSPKKLFGRGVIGLLISAWALLFWTPPVGSEWLKPAIVIGGIVLFISAWKAFSDPKTAWNYFVNAGSCVHDVIQQWTPKQYRLELEYEKDLHAFLKQRLPFAKITRQYGSGRIKCDLAVATDVMIELKVKLTSTNKLQRLLGQIELFQKEWEDKPLIVALLGAADQDLLHELHNSVKRYRRVYVVMKDAKEVLEESEEAKSVSGRGD